MEVLVLGWVFVPGDAVLARWVGMKGAYPV